MNSLLHAITAAILVAWFCTAVAWGTAGVAVASWGRLPLWIGALVGAALPLLGVLVLTGLAVSRRRTGPRQLSQSAARPVGGSEPSGAARSVGGGFWVGDPYPPVPGPFEAPVTGAPLGAAALAMPLDPSLDQPRPFDFLPIQPGTPPLAPERRVGLGAVSLRNRRLFIAIAGVLSISLLLTLFVNNWVRVGVASGVSFGLNAWDIGLGEMLVFSALEFAVFAAVAWRWRTRWIGVLAVFAGTWWFLLWSVACLAGGGIRELTRDIRAVRELRHAALTAGPIWYGVLVIAVLMVCWGLAELSLEHLEATER